MKKIFRTILSQAGLAVTSTENLANLRTAQEEFFELKKSVLSSKIGHLFSPDAVTNALSELRNSKAQLHQDLVVLLYLDFKRNGFFVEFGATNGIKFSNTFLLENAYGWSGILAEPGKNWHKDLRANRNSIIDTRCVWKSSGELLEFNETDIGELSTLQMFSKVDLHSEQRKLGRIYDVETVSLEDLLDQNSAPEFIDYLSVDTEGSEFEILSSIDFRRHTFGFISCEHNFTENRAKVFDLLISNGYTRVLEEVSLFDDWFIHNTLVKAQ